MKRSLAIGLICLGLTGASEARIFRATTGTQFFCTKEENMLMYAAANNVPSMKDRKVPGCMTPKKGTRYTVIETDPTRSTGGVVHVRLGSPYRIEGYLMTGRAD